MAGEMKDASNYVLEALLEQARAHEREACASLVEAYSHEAFVNGTKVKVDDVVAAIRARGAKPALTADG